MSISQNAKRQIISVGITCVISWCFAFLATHVFVAYAFGLFIWLPVVMGALSTILYAYKNETSKYSCRNVAFLTLFIFCLGLLSFAFEGLICIIMAAPIGLLFTWIGYLIGYAIIKNKTKL